MNRVTLPAPVLPVWSRGLPRTVIEAGASADGPLWAERGASPAGPSATAADPSAHPREDVAAERNNLLQLLAAESPAEYAALLAATERVELQHKAALYEANVPIRYVYFPQSAVCSVVKQMGDGEQIEVGTIGLEGMVGVAVFLGGVSSPTVCIAQIPGAAVRIGADAFRAAALPCTRLHSLVQRFAQYQLDQTAQTAACNRLHSVETRCARWLLMTHDRVGDSRFPLTQEYLAVMLGVRRAGVNVAAGRLQAAGLIRYRRGGVQVLDRGGLESVACECYRTDRSDYRRLLG